MRPFGFGPERRLKRRSEIASCRDKGTKVYSKHFLILLCASKSPGSRLAVAITTKIDKRAVVRNRIKRRIKEVFRLNQHRFRAPMDLLVVARRDVQQCEYSDYLSEILGSLRSKGYFSDVEPIKSPQPKAEE